MSITVGSSVRIKQGFADVDGDGVKPGYIGTVMLFPDHQAALEIDQPYLVAMMVEWLEELD